MEPQRSSRWALVLVVLNFFAEPSGGGPVPDSCVAAELAPGAWGALPPIRRCAESPLRNSVRGTQQHQAMHSRL
jgi:hypothetical protein